MADLIIKSKIKEALPKDKEEMRIASDLAEELNKKVEQILKRAAERAKANHRTTILPQDI
jgi:histone H3/H4